MRPTQVFGKTWTEWGRSTEYRLEQFPQGAVSQQKPTVHTSSYLSYLRILADLPTLPRSPPLGLRKPLTHLSPSLVQGEASCCVFSSLGLRCTLYPCSRCPKTARAEGQPAGAEAALVPGLWVREDAAASPTPTPTREPSPRGLLWKSAPEKPVPPTSRSCLKSETQETGGL